MGLYPTRVELERGCLTPVLRLDDIRPGDRLVGLSEGVTLEEVATTVGKRHEQAEGAVLGQGHHDQAAVTEEVEAAGI
nr:hypothetical protein [Pseudomonas sp.]